MTEPAPTDALHDVPARDDTMGEVIEAMATRAALEWIGSLQAAPPPHEHPWQDEAYAAIHGGRWRAPYQPRRALGLAPTLSYRAART